MWFIESMTGRGISPFLVLRLVVVYDVSKTHVVLRRCGDVALVGCALVSRIEKKANLNDWDYSSFYGGTEKGFTDYPSMADA